MARREGKSIIMGSKPGPGLGGEVNGVPAKFLGIKIFRLANLESDNYDCVGSLSLNAVADAAAAAAAVQAVGLFGALVLSPPALELLRLKHLNTRLD